MDMNDDSDFVGYRTVSSDRGPESGSETRRKHFISYPPSPLSTDFETTDSSDPGDRISKIFPRGELCFSEQEQSAFQRVRSENNAAQELQRVCKIPFPFFQRRNFPFHNSHSWIIDFWLDSDVTFATIGSTEIREILGSVTSIIHKEVFYHTTRKSTKYSYSHID
jgi:hypothetical protein